MKKLLTLIILILGFSCSENDNEAPELTSIVIEGPFTSLVENQTLQLSLTGFDQNNSTISINSRVDWTANSEHVSVDQNGLVTALSIGTSVITASTQSLSAEYTVEILERTLTRIALTSTDGTKIDLNETTTIQVVGYDQANIEVELEDVVFTIDNENISIDDNGLVTALLVGETEITATSANVSASITIRVWDSTAPRIEIYVSDVGVNRNGPHQILKYNEEGKEGTAFISSNLAKPQDIVFIEDQEVVLVSNLQSNKITKHAIETGEYISDFATGLSGPTRMEIGPDGLLYVIGWNGGSVKRYQLDGTFVDNFTNSSINQAIGIAWDSEGNLYVSSFNDGSNGFVKVFNENGDDQGFFINSNLTGPTDIWFQENGNLLVSDWSANRVREFSSDGEFIGDYITNLSQPEGVDYMNGNLLIGNSGDGSVKMYDATGNFIEDLVAPGAGGLETTNAVTVRYVNY